MILVDGMMLVHRCYAKMDFLRNSAGVHTGMEYGFLKNLETLPKRLGDDSGMIVCWDSKVNKKKQAYPDYKANRGEGESSKDAGFYERVTALKKLVQCLYPCAEVEGYEADDVMGTLSKRYDKCYIYSNDKDLLQVVRPGCVLITSRDSQLWLWDDEEVMAEYGVTPAEFTLWKAFFGDKGDNIIGVSRVSKEKAVKCIRGNDKQTAIGLLLSPGTWTDKEFDRVAEICLAKNYALVKLVNVPVEPMMVPDDEYVQKRLRELEIRSLKICKGMTDGLANEPF